MKILAIETSCDETAISVVEFNNRGEPRVLSHLVSSQTKIHQPFGGVVPNLAARAHQTNLIPVLKQALIESSLFVNLTKLANSNSSRGNEVDKVLKREPELLARFKEFLPTIAPPGLDAIAVTQGPGLEPALWVGINFAKALAITWQKPLIPTNHMTGHIYSIFLQKYGMPKIEFPAIALLISGGHTELILMNPVSGRGTLRALAATNGMKDWQTYKLLGQTRDDAVGEAFDKVARLLGLPYPGGPQISRLAEQFQDLKGQTLGAPKGLPLVPQTLVFPRPMLDSNDYDFSFSGLKTAVRYKIETLRQSSGRLDLPEQIKSEIAYEFQEAVIEVLIKKTMRAVREYGVKTLIIGGGVIANLKLRRAFESATKGQAFEDPQGLPLKLLIPELKYTTDNATMIAIAAYQHLLSGRTAQKVLPPRPEVLEGIRAEGNLRVC